MKLFIKILAVYRLCILLIDDDCPYEACSKLRDFVGVRYTMHGERAATNELAKLFNCPYCLSLWLGLIVSKFKPLEALAISGGATMLYILDEKIHTYHAQDVYVAVNTTDDE